MTNNETNNAPPGRPARKPVFILTGERRLAGGVAALLGQALAGDRLARVVVKRAKRMPAAAPIEQPAADPAQPSRQVRRAAARLAATKSRDA
jgi:hypothetical protein